MHAHFRKRRLIKIKLGQKKKSKLRDESREIEILQQSKASKKRKTVAEKGTDLNVSKRRKIREKALTKKGKTKTGEKKDNMPRKKYVKPTDNLVLRVPPTSFMTVIKDMPEDHKKAIEEIGFGGFLHLDMPYHKASFAEPLVRSFDIDRHCLVMEDNQVIDLKPEDAHIAYGIPIGGKEIIEPKDESDERWCSFLREWRASCNLPKGSPTNQYVIRELEVQKGEPVTDRFLRNFVLAAVNCCIRSTCNPMLRFKFLYNCMDVQQIKTYNWAAYVCKAAEESVLEWVVNKSSYFTGPLPFLMV